MKCSIILYYRESIHIQMKFKANPSKITKHKHRTSLPPTPQLMDI